MTQPLSKWDDEDPQHGRLVWVSKLDSRYLCEVQRTGEYSAELCVFDHAEGDKELARWPVSLSYGARFGPDVDDVASWQQQCVAHIDGLPLLAR